MRRAAALGLMLAIPAAALGGYAAIKGEVSEKLSVRWAAGLGPQNILRRSVPQQASRGLDDPRWDFSAKEESEHYAIRSGRSTRSSASSADGGRRWRGTSP